MLMDHNDFIMVSCGFVRGNIMSVECSCANEGTRIRSLYSVVLIITNEL